MTVNLDLVDLRGCFPLFSGTLYTREKTQKSVSRSVRSKKGKKEKVLDDDFGEDVPFLKDEDE